MDNDAHGYVTDIEYVAGFYDYMDPAYLRYIAFLNNSLPSTRANFRYLELGCGLGQTTLTLAAGYPDAEFIGVDVNDKHIATMETERAQRNITNLKPVRASFDKLPKNLGKFDFIGLHGVFSWVAPEVRQQILQVATRHLADGGLLLVSYNAMPGWAHLQPIRQILREYAVLQPGDKLAKMQAAQKYLVFLRDKHAAYFIENPAAARYVDFLVKQHPNYLVHEYFNEHWTSLYFTEVAKLFTQIGMEYVGSLPIQTNFWDLCVRPEFSTIFQTTEDRLTVESHKDFCGNTGFRWDIYGRELAPLADERATADTGRYALRQPADKIRFPLAIQVNSVTSRLDLAIHVRLAQVLAQGPKTLAGLIDALKREYEPAEVIRGVDLGMAFKLLELTAAAPLAPLA